MLASILVEMRRLFKLHVFFLFHFTFRSSHEQNKFYSSRFSLVLRLPVCVRSLPFVLFAKLFQLASFRIMPYI